MDVGISATTAELRTAIRGIIGDTEKLFLKLAGTYPTFVREMQRSLENSERAVGSLGSGESLESTMRNLFDSTRRVLAESASHFKEMHVRDDALLSSLNAGIEKLSGLDSVIARIKEDSIEMELISLNAMTVALKSGAAGKAFSVITDELKRLSMRTISLTELLTEDGRALLDKFRRFKVEVEKLETSQNEVFDDLDARIRERFDSLEVAVRDIGSSLAELVDRSRGVALPVRAIMETVQVQDIVRQSLDHVVLALDEIDQVSSGDPLDDLAFRRRLAELAESILADVRLSLGAALETLRSQSGSVKAIVADGDKRRRTLLEGSFGADGSGAASRSFAETSEALDRIGSQVSSYMRTKASISAEGSRLSTAVESLETRFKSFGKIINRFRTIDIASRIEVSKQAILRTMNDTVDEMSHLTDRIGADVQEALEATKSFIGETKAAIEDYSKVADEEGALVERSASSLKAAHARLSELKDSIRSGASNFNLFTPSFIALLDASSKDVETLGGIVSSIAAASSSLSSFRSTAAEALDSAGASDRYDDLHSDRMKEIIDRFTIYAHKQAAAELGGFDVEDAVDNGEVTFF